MIRSAFTRVFATTPRRRRIRPFYAVESLTPRLMLSADSAAGLIETSPVPATSSATEADTHTYPSDGSAADSYTDSQPFATDIPSVQTEMLMMELFTQPDLLPSAQDLFGNVPADSAVVPSFNEADATSDAAAAEFTNTDSTVFPAITDSSLVSFFVGQQDQAGDTSEPDVEPLDPFDLFGESQSDETKEIEPTRPTVNVDLLRKIVRTLV